MPLYEYECSACGERYDRLQSASAPVEPPCPACGAAESRRLISLVAGLGSRGAAAPARTGPSSGCGCGGACACGR